MGNTYFDLKVESLGLGKKLNAIKSKIYGHSKQNKYAYQFVKFFALEYPNARSGMTFGVRYGPISCYSKLVQIKLKELNITKISTKGDATSRKKNLSQNCSLLQL